MQRLWTFRSSTLLSNWILGNTILPLKGEVRSGWYNPKTFEEKKYLNAVYLDTTQKRFTFKNEKVYF